MKKDLGDSVIDQNKLRTAQDIHELILENQKDIAFITGNGVNLYFANKNQPPKDGITNIKSWEELLLSLWNKESVNKLETISLGISFPEFFDLVDLKRTSLHPFYKELYKKYGNVMATILLSDDKDYKEKIYKIERKMAKELSDKIKVDICKEIENWARSCEIKEFVLAIERLNVPLLTTNFDNALNSSLNLKEMRMQNPKNGSPKDLSNSNETFWNCYYSYHDLYLPTSGFGIWHINGCISHSKSISFGLCDYMYNVTRARKLLQGLHKSEEFVGKNQPYWAGCNTWLHVIFNKSLFIFGLALDENEVFLRWLLIQRAKYFSSRNIPYKGWYIVCIKDNMNDGKKFFLESVGFEIIYIEDYSIMYEDVWKIID